MTDRDQTPELPLPSDQLAELFRSRVAVHELRGQSSANPTVIMTAGQTGAGKSAIVTALTSDLGLSETAVTVNTDRVRAHHPALPWLFKHDKRNAYLRTDPDARAWVGMALTHAIDHRFDVVFDGTLSRPAAAEKIAGQFRDAKYQSSIVFMAVPAAYSWLGVLQRCQAHLEQTGQVWYSTNHDETYEGLLDTAELVDQKVLVDQVLVYRRGGELLYRNQKDDQGQWMQPPGTRAAIEAERVRPRDAEELRAFSAAALALAERMGPEWHADIARAVELALPLASTADNREELQATLAQLTGQTCVASTNTSDNASEHHSSLEEPAPSDNASVADRPSTTAPSWMRKTPRHHDPRGRGPAGANPTPDNDLGR